MTQAKPLALFTLALALTGCAGNTSSPNTPSLDWETPGMQLGGDRGLPLRVDTPLPQARLRQRQAVLQPRYARAERQQHPPWLVGKFSFAGDNVSYWKE